FFKKIVISNNEVELHRLPFMFDNMKNKNRETETDVIIHQEDMFLESLKNLLSDQAREMFGSDFFVNGDKFGSEEIYQLLKQNKGVVK
ncbi:hypothetical protein, partial [Neobacillus vireti]